MNSFLLVLGLGVVGLVIYLTNANSVMSRQMTQMTQRLLSLEARFEAELQSRQDTQPAKPAAHVEPTVPQPVVAAAVAQPARNGVAPSTAPTAPLRPATGTVVDVNGRKTEVAPSPVPSKPAPARVQVPIPAPLPAPPSLFSRAATQLQETPDWEVLVGGRLLNRIGAVALILGLGFFFKYAVDQNWIGRPIRVIMGVALGGVLLYLADRTRKRGLEVFSQGIVGAGIAAFFISTYAAYNLYHLVPAPIALVAMLAVTAIGLQQALRYGSIAVSLIAMFGGFLGPLFQITAHPDAKGFLIYLLLLNVEILAVLQLKPVWSILEPIALVSTYSIVFIWQGSSYQGHNAPLMTTALLGLIWLAYVAYDLFGYNLNRRGPRFNPELHHLLAVANGVAFYSALCILIAPYSYQWFAAATVPVLCVYGIAAAWTMQNRKFDEITVARYTVSAIIFLALIPAIQFGGFVTVIVWSCEALALVGLGVLTKKAYIWQPAILLYGCALGLLVANPSAFHYQSLGEFLPFLNERSIAFVVLAVSLGLSTYLLKRLQGQKVRFLWIQPSAANVGMVRHGMAYLACLLVLVLVTVDINDLFNRFMIGAHGNDLALLGYQRFISIALAWMIDGLSILYFGMRMRFDPLVAAGVAACAAAVVMGGVISARFTPLQSLQPFIDVRLALMVVLIAGVLLVHLWRRNASATVPGLRSMTFLPALAVAMGFELLTSETNDTFSKQALTQGLSQADVFHEALVLSAIFIVYALPLIWFGLRRGSNQLLACGLASATAAVVVGATIGAAFQPARDFVLVLNWRFAVFALLIVSLALTVRWLPEDIGHPGLRRLSRGMQVLAVWLGFELLTVEINDVFRARAVTNGVTPETVFAEAIILSAAWIIYSTPLVWIGVKRTLDAILLTGLAAGFAAVSVAMFEGALFTPSDQFGTVLVVRAVVFVLIVACLIAQLQWLRERSREAGEVADLLRPVITGCQAVIVLLGFELLSVQIRDIFTYAIQAKASNTNDLRNLEQLTLSLAWLVYAIGLIVFGIWRRMRWLRLAAMALFAFIIIKIFAYDLGFLKAALRSISFVGLGVILLAVSYLYQRYRSILLEATASSASIPADDGGAVLPGIPTVSDSHAATPVPEEPVSIGGPSR